MRFERIVLEMLDTAKDHSIIGLAIVAVLVAFKSFTTTINARHKNLHFAAFSITVAAFIIVTSCAKKYDIVSPPAVESAKVLEQNARDVVSVIESAVRDKDVDKLLSVFWDDSKISIERESGKSKTFSRSQYKHIASLAFLLPSTYDTKKVKDVFQVSTDGKYVTVTTLLLEHAVVGSIETSALSNQIMTIEVKDGRPVVTSVAAKVLSTDVGKSQPKNII